MPPIRKNLATRFWEKVDAVGSVCWNWTGGVDKDGYGQIWVNDTVRRARANRVAWFLTFGAIPDGKSVLHTCDNPLCVNPAHLFLGTTADNNRDRRTKKRSAYGSRNGAYTQPHRRRTGVLNGRAKLDMMKVREIRAAYATGVVYQNDLAALYGVSQRSICKIVRNESYVEK